MSAIILKRGTKKDLEKEKLQDGLLSFTTDDGKIHLDYTNEDGELKRKTFYSGVLTFGKYSYDGSTDVSIDIYEGSVEE